MHINSERERERMYIHAYTNCPVAKGEGTWSLPIVFLYMQLVRDSLNPLSLYTFIQYSCRFHDHYFSKVYVNSYVSLVL